MKMTPNEEFNKAYDIYKMDALNGKGTDEARPNREDVTSEIERQVRKELKGKK